MNCSEITCDKHAVQTLSCKEGNCGRSGEGINGNVLCQDFLIPQTDIQTSNCPE